MGCHAPDPAVHAATAPEGENRLCFLRTCVFDIPTAMVRHCHAREDMEVKMGFKGEEEARIWRRGG